MAAMTGIMSAVFLIGSATGPEWYRVVGSSVWTLDSTMGLYLRDMKAKRQTCGISWNYEYFNNAFILIEHYLFHIFFRNWPP